MSKEKKNLLDMDVSAMAKGSHGKMNKAEKPKKQKQIPFTMTIPENFYEKLDSEALRLGTSKKAIIMQGLRHVLKVV